jgi:hypothetical protein
MSRVGFLGLVTWQLHHRCLFSWCVVVRYVFAAVAIARSGCELLRATGQDVSGVEHNNLVFLWWCCLQAASKQQTLL